MIDISFVEKNTVVLFQIFMYCVFSTYIPPERKPIRVWYGPPTWTVCVADTNMLVPKSLADPTRAPARAGVI